MLDKLTLEGTTAVASVNCDSKRPGTLKYVDDNGGKFQVCLEVGGTWQTLAIYAAPATSCIVGAITHQHLRVWKKGVGCPQFINIGNRFHLYQCDMGTVVDLGEIEDTCEESFGGV